MTVLHVLEIEILVGLSVFGLAYGAITLVLWRLSKESERRQREREAARATTAANEPATASRS